VLYQKRTPFQQVLQALWHIPPEPVLLQDAVGLEKCFHKLVNTGTSSRFGIHGFEYLISDVSVVFLKANLPIEIGKQFLLLNVLVVRNPQFLELLVEYLLYFLLSDSPHNDIEILI